MKLTIDQDGISVTIIHNSVISLDEVMQEVIRPALIGLGYHNDSVDKFILSEYSEDSDDGED